MNKLTKSVYMLLGLLAYGTVTLAVCPLYMQYQEAEQKAQQEVQRLQKEVKGFNQMLAMGGLNPFEKPQVIQSREFRLADLQQATETLDKAQDALHKCEIAQ